MIYYFRICGYATTTTQDSVYIIGGNTKHTTSTISTIAKFTDYMWTNAGNLQQARSAHGAITIKGRTMIIGGSSDSGATLVKH